MTWSPDGKYLAAIDSPNKQIHVLTPLDGKIVSTGRFIAVVDEGDSNNDAIYVWQVGWGQVRQQKA